jgi:thiol-disulfide isomerase/thioredoxin
MKCNILLLQFLVGIILANICSAQTTSTSPVAIGNEVPNLKFKNLLNSPYGTISMHDFHGKAIILDFWATWCQPCIAMMPKMQTFQDKFANSLQIISITKEPRETIETFLNKMSHTKPIHLLKVYSDSTTRKYFPYKTLPHYVWIDKHLNVKAITSSEEINEENIRKLISGDSINLKVKTDKDLFEKEPDTINVWIKDLLGYNFAKNGDKLNPALLHNSMLTTYIKGELTTSNTTLPTTPFANRRIRVTNASVSLLFRLAYGDKEPVHLNRVIFEIKDSLKKQTAIWTDPNNKTNLFCYDLIIPKANRIKLFLIMQKDLTTYFDLNAHWETRTRECAIIKCVDKSKFKISSGDKPSLDVKKFWLKAKNQPLSKIVSSIQHFNQVDGPVFIDESNISVNVDLEINAQLDDLETLKRELNKYGLDIVKESRAVSMLIVKD